MIEAFEKACSDWRHIRIKHIPEQSRFLLDSGCLVLDTETTGLGFDDEVCEICIMDASGTTMLDTLVRPTQPIPAAVTAIHGITNDAVSAAPTMADLYPVLQQIIGQRLVVTYNANFDGRLMAQSCRLHQLERVLQPEQTSCLMIAYAHLRGEWDDKRRAYKWFKLVDACAQMGIEWTGTAHRAAADTAMTLALLRAMADRETAA